MSISTHRSGRRWSTLTLHEHTAFGPVLSNGRRVLVNLSPRRLLGHPFEAATWACAFELRPVHAGHGCYGGDVEHIPHAVLRILGGALCIGHSADLPRQISPLKKIQEKTYVKRIEIENLKIKHLSSPCAWVHEQQESRWELVLKATMDKLCVCVSGR